MADDQDNGQSTGGNLYPIHTEEGKKFTPDNQPTPEARSIGQKRRYATRELLQMFAGAIETKSGQDLRELAARFYNCEAEAVTTSMLMDWAMIDRAIKKKDPAAYKAVKDRGLGRPMVEQIPEQEKHVEKRTIKLGNNPDGTPREIDF